MAELVCRSPTTLSRELAGDAVLYSPDSGATVVLDGTAALIWELLAEPVSIDELSRELADAYSEDVGTIRRDVDALIARLGADGFVEVR